MEHFPSPNILAPHHQDLFASVPFTQYTVFGFQQKVARHIKRKKIYFEETEPTSEPDSDITGVFELSDQEFKITD